MRFLTSLIAAAATLTGVASFPAQPLEFKITKRADPNLVGYAFAYFVGDEPSVYLDLSNGNQPLSFKALNSGEHILDPTSGTGGVRDPSIIAGGGDEAGKKWYIIGTDLDIAQTTWDLSQRNGSLSIFVWESSDLVNWGSERLVKVEDDTAGMVWAPDAIWDSAQGQYLVHWASRFYAESDTEHTGDRGPATIRYAYTSDFTTISAPKTLIDAASTSLIDLAILDLGNNSYARFLKNEDVTKVYYELSADGLFGTWTRPGGSDAFIRSGAEGPTVFLDNINEGEVHLWLDFFGDGGYQPFERSDLDTDTQAWTESDRTSFPTDRRHGSVVPINQVAYDALNSRYG